MDLAELTVLRERELLDDAAEMQPLEAADLVERAEVARVGNEPRWMLTLATSRRLRGVA